jgi:hypothetical protein
VQKYERGTNGRKKHQDNAFRVLEKGYPEIFSFGGCDRQANDVCDESMWST